MKRYKLLKELPFAKAGEEFEEGTGKRNSKPEKTLISKNHITTIIWIKDIDNFNEWFEEVEELKTFFLINNVLSEVVEHNIKYYKDWQIENLKSVGNYFETEEEAEKYLEYLKAKEVIKQDTEGFEPDWSNPSQKRFFGYFNLIDKTLCHFNIGENMESKIFFGSREDIEESFKKHREEWKIYLTYEQ